MGLFFKGLFLCKKEAFQVVVGRGEGEGESRLGGETRSVFVVMA